MAGHVLVFRDNLSNRNDMDEFALKIQPHIKGFVAASPFLVLEAVASYEKKVSGIVLEGVDEKSVHKVLNYPSRIQEGSFDLSSKKGIYQAVVGQGVAQHFGLKTGEIFRVVIPLTEQESLGGFRPQVKLFQLSGIVDLGRHDYNQRYVVVSLQATEDLWGSNSGASGLRLLLSDDDLAQEVSENIRSLGYGSSYWFEMNKNLFEAAQLEKVVIFFVLLIMVIAAAFNISSTLYVSVMERFSDISVLKVLGASQKFLLFLFSFQGFLIGFIGGILGLLLGLGACYTFMWAQKEFGLISGEIYKLDHLEVDLRWLDLLSIFMASLVICWLSTLAPARKGAYLVPTKGLRYE